MSRPDPSVLGTSGYERFENDHYVTPARTIKSLLSVIEDDLPAFPVWEPFCGTGAFSTLLEGKVQNIVSTDIREYPGFTPDGLFDFFDITPKKKLPDRNICCGFGGVVDPVDPNGPVFKTLDDIATLKGFTPDVIISNPPYEDAERYVRHAIDLMEDVKGDVILLLRNEWDCAKRHADLFRHPAFRAKIVLQHRPRWIEGSKGSPRHNYAYYWWAWSKMPGNRAEIFHAA